MDPAQKTILGNNRLYLFVVASNELFICGHDQACEDLLCSVSGAAMLFASLRSGRNDTCDRWCSPVRLKKHRSTCSEQKFTDPVRFTKPESPTQLYFHRSLCTGRWAFCFGRDRVACRILSAGFPVGGSSDRLLSNSSASPDAGDDLLASFLQRSWVSVQRSILPRRSALASRFFDRDTLFSGEFSTACSLADGCPAIPLSMDVHRDSSDMASR